MPGGIIAAVDPGSLAQRMGLEPGDELLAINDRPVRDVIDVQFHAAEEHLTLRVRRGDDERTLRARRRYDEPLGLEFARPTFEDDIRRCTNHCEFCFVAQMPPGLRRPLYVKDDDYRHSFLFGNYVTLTNLSERDWQRIEEQRLSPLYVSVHSTDPALRRRILRAPAAPDVLEQLTRLAEMGAEIHTQVVLTPELNDGAHLERSIADLAALYPAVASLSVVPVGLTRFHRGDCRLQTPAESRAVFEQVNAWQARLLPAFDARFVYLSDEWYLRLSEPVPPLEAYDDLDLTENGVGLVRQFLERLAPGNPQPATRLAPRPTTLVTATLFAPLLRQVTADWPGVEVVAVENRFFGTTVTVAGLLTVQDVVEQLAGRPLGERVVLPAVMFGGPQGQSLDERLPDDVAQALGCEIVLANTLDECFPPTPSSAHHSHGSRKSGNPRRHPRRHSRGHSRASGNPHP